MAKNKSKARYRDESLRLVNRDYSKKAAYFITICTRNRTKYFGLFKDSCMYLSDLGKIAHNNLIDIPSHFPNAAINTFVIMPDHIHSIIVIKNNVGTLHARSPQNGPEKNQFMSTISPKAGSLSTIIRSYKSSVTRMARTINNGFEWQSGYHDRIIRNRFELIRVQKYISDHIVSFKEPKL